MQSLVTPLGYSAESCGYCKDASTGRRTPNSRCSYYITSKSLSTQAYQDLVDRGWRRSGTILYKPDVLRHCCPHYTIRLPAASFNPAKEHRHAVNRWNKHILGEDYIKEAAKLYPKTKQEKARQRNGFDLVSTIHEGEFEKLKRPPEPAHRFEVILEPDEFTDEKFELFSNYQQHVHHDGPSDVSKDGFKRFLCGSPLQRTIREVDGHTQQLGSYHQCYRLDGRLIAMSVLDLLPHCVSSVYSIYHSDFEKWSFGKLSAMREIALASEGGYQFYYMGYYIHSCVKMRYKGEYRPSYILDPETYEWNPLDGELRRLLDAKAYVSLSRERRRREDTAIAAQDIENESKGDAGDAGDTPEVAPEYPLLNAEDAGKAVMQGMSLFELKVPGLMTVEQIEHQVQLDHTAIQIRKRSITVEAGDLMNWEKSYIRDPRSLKGVIGELVAAIGPEVVKQVVVDFG
ncbi:arginine-tRNA-protein transferase 1 [Lindgomyces ingoldianus]|uniref:Arginine-tRNA-protein transferase 1 n=1 Tax=Lindgomyces ingoldianus TaxID=673940 RepID=A0ACB6QV62_9PLEO|nr:arginine-tRNA-protein transferase 1 [Lindgomyces ingoldianus]KAF2470790.1 arginine-tRNA-protein transferase 1 [Lindgomyces ingoldianus]